MTLTLKLIQPPIIEEAEAATAVVIDITSVPPQTGKTIPKWKANKIRQAAMATAKTSLLPSPTPSKPPTATSTLPRKQATV